MIVTNDILLEFDHLRLYLQKGWRCAWETERIDHRSTLVYPWGFGGIFIWRFCL